MFLGYQNNLLALVAETKEALEDNPCLKFTAIEETVDPVEKIGNSYYVGQDAINEAKAAYAREIRDAYLIEYVDPIASNALRWNDLTEEKQTTLKNYRQYLLDLPQDDGFPNVTVKTFDQWVNAL